jgi:hypothetical protein
VKLKPKIKLYLYHGHRQEIDVDMALKHSLLTRWLLRSGRLIFAVCYTTGVLILAVGHVVASPLKLLKDHKRSERPQRQRMRFQELFRYPELRLTLGIFIALLIISISSLEGAVLITKGLELKGKVLGSATQGLNYLQNAEQLLGKQESELAAAQFNRALNQFTVLEQELDNLGLVTQKLMQLVPGGKQGQSLLEIASLMSQAGVDISRFASIASNLRLTAQGLTGADDAPETLGTLQDLLAQTRIRINRAAELLGTVSIESLPAHIRPQLQEGQTKLLQMKQSLAIVEKIVSIGNKTLSGDQHVLILLQNNNELRPTGGFIGTVGALNLQHGTITSLDVQSVYDLDGQLTEAITPPYPLRFNNQRWYLRDSNWFADFPTSARIASSFYEKSGRETPDLIIGLTPQLIIDLLDLTGPLTVPQHAVTLTAENFIEQTQVATAVTYNKTINAPKQLLADCVPLLLDRLAHADTDTKIRMLAVLEKNLGSKDIMLYSRDLATQRTISQLGWGGEQLATDRDYLSVNSSNLAGTKTDTYLKDNIQLTSAVDEQGIITNTATLTRFNPLPALPEMLSLTFLRFYVPKDSKLIRAEGFSHIDIPPDNGNRSLGLPEVQNWESSLVKNIGLDTVMGQEHGLSFFGNWLEVAGGQKKTVSITYQLPFRLQSTDRYSLLIQKQPGAQPAEFSWMLSYPTAQSMWTNFTPTELQPHQLTYTGKIDKDYFLGTVLSTKK